MNQAVKKPLAFHTLQERVSAYCAKHADIVAAYLFGSTVTGQATPLSDIDLAFLLTPQKPRLPRSLAYQAACVTDMMDLLETNHVDVVLLPASSPLLHHRIISRGRVLFCRNDRQRQAFEFKALQTYLDLKPLYAQQTRMFLERVRSGHFGNAGTHG